MVTSLPHLHTQTAWRLSEMVRLQSWLNSVEVPDGWRVDIIELISR